MEMVPDHCRAEPRLKIGYLPPLARARMGLSRFLDETYGRAHLARIAVIPQASKWLGKPSSAAKTTCNCRAVSPRAEEQVHNGRRLLNRVALTKLEACETLKISMIPGQEHGLADHSRGSDRDIVGAAAGRAKPAKKIGSQLCHFPRKRDDA